MKRGRGLIAATAVAASLIVPAAASAAPSAKVTDDGGNPAPLTPGAPLGLHNMDVKAFGNTAATGDGLGFTISVIGPDGQPAATTSYCQTPGVELSKSVDYKGNGQYTLTLSTYTDKLCTAGKKDFVYAWTVAAGVAIAPPAATMLTRQPNSFATISQQFNFVGNVGALGYEIKYAKGATVNPDGSLNSPAIKDGFVNASGKVDISSREPGQYTVVARAKSFTPGYFTPWTPPAFFNLVAPFDISSRTFPDQRGPSYQVRATLGDAVAAGSRVTIAAAKGKHGKRFRTLGKPKINSNGQVTLRFRLKLGTYRMRYSFKGNSVMARGTVYDTVRIKRVLG